MIIENTWGRALAGAVALVVTLGVAPFARAAEAAAEEALEPTPADDLKVTQAASLDDLLRNVEQRRVVESREHANREAVLALAAEIVARAQVKPGGIEHLKLADQHVGIGRHLPEAAARLPPAFAFKAAVEGAGGDLGAA